MHLEVAHEESPDLDRANVGLTRRARHVERAIRLADHLQPRPLDLERLHAERSAHDRPRQVHTDRIGVEEGGVGTFSRDLDAAELGGERQQVVVEPIGADPQASVGLNPLDRPREDAGAHVGHMGHADKHRDDREHPGADHQPALPNPAPPGHVRGGTHQ